MASSLKLKPEPEKVKVKLTVAVPRPLHQQLELYRKRLGPDTSMSYVIEAGLKTFLREDRAFQKKLLEGPGA